jgi:glycosyltransferase involved in cell wall biosynthesis
MKILQIGPYPPPHGGVQHNLCAIRQFLNRRGISNEVINLTRYRKPHAGGVYYPKNWLQTLRLLLRLRYDIVHLHIGGSLTPRLLGLSLVCSLMPRSKAVLTFHSGGYPGSPEGTSARPRSFRGFVFRRFDLIIAVNTEIVALFRRFGVPADRIRLIYPHAFIDEPHDELAEPLKGFFTAHRPVLITAGLLEPEYDLTLQIDILAAVRERYRDAGLVIIGSGALEGDLRRYIDSKPYGEHVLLCGDVPHSMTLRAVADSDLFLRTTLYDGDSIAVREALHLGTRVIATDTGMRPRGVHLIPRSNPDALLGAVHELLHRHPDRPQPPAPSDDNVKAVFDQYRELIETNRS